MIDEISVDREQRIRRALQHLRNNTTDQWDRVTTFVAAEHTDAGLAERERELIFGRVPTVVCHSSEIARPGDFHTVQLPRHNVVVARQPDGAVTTVAGVGRDLVELPTEERHGFVWTVDNPGAVIDVAAWLGSDMDSILAGYGIADLHCVRAEGFDEPVNWKVMQDAFLDGYHIAYAHPNSAAKHVHTNVMAFEDFGRHCRFITPRKTIDKWIDADPPLGQSLVSDVIETHFLGPCHTLLKQPDHYQLLTFWPDPVHANRSWMEMRLLVIPQESSRWDAEKWQHLWDKNWEILLLVLHQEDFPLLRAAQTGLASRDAGPMLIGRNEVANQVFHRETLRLLEAADDDVSPPLAPISAGVGSRAAFAS